MPDALVEALLNALVTIGPIGVFLLVAWRMYLQAGSPALFGKRNGAYATAAELAIHTAQRNAFTVADVAGAVHTAFERERIAINRTAEDVAKLEQRQETFNATSATIAHAQKQMAEILQRIDERLDQQLEHRVAQLPSPRRRR